MQPDMQNIPQLNPVPQQNLSNLPAQQEQASQQQKNTNRNKYSAQNTLLISEIRDNMVVMVDGSYRAVVECESINFDLMNPRERDGVELLFQNFLNSLNHPVQILVRSRRVDIGPYMEKLYTIRSQQDNMLLNVLMDDYMSFIDMLAQQYAIMDKSFYVVVPYNNTGDLTTIIQQSRGLFDKLFAKNKPVVTKIDKNTYQKALDEITRRVESVAAGLRQIGLKCSQLNSLQLGELYYSYYNPDTAIDQPLKNYNSLATTYVMKGNNYISGGGLNV